ncbi:TonB-dependent receptor [Fretibacter rubidus]|uniref:TonB-dependent receptor n=1 Tax=Fretibacter rubidus TaxID=570162 RepID=UPI003529E20B
MKQLLSKTIKTSLLASAAATVIALAATSAAFAQDSGPNNLDAPDEIIVTGIKATTANALQTKRKADVILDGISADDLGNFPDLNLGEALQRITGVQIDREAGRRNATISVRGLPGNFTKTTLMGQNISNPNRTGSNPFGVFDSAIFNGVDVEKSFTAQSLSGGLAANVNLKLKSALDRRDGSLVLRAKADYEELPKTINPGFYASGAKHLGDEKFGVYGTVSYSKQDFRRDAINFTRYERNARNLNVAGETHLYVGDIRQFVEESIGDRLSAASGIEYQPTENLSFRLDGLFTQRNLDEATQDNIQIQPRLSASQITSVSGPELVGNFDFDQNGSNEDVFLHRVIDFEDPQVVFGNRDDESLNETYALYPQLNWENDNLKINVTGTYSKSKSNAIFNQFDTRILQTGGATSTNGASNGVTGTLDTGGSDIRDFDFDLNIPEGTLQLGGGGYAITSGTGISAIRFEDGRRHQFTVAGFAQGAERDLKAISGDVEYKFSKGPFVGVKFGGRYEDEAAEIYRFENSIIGLNINNLDNSVIVPNASLTSGQGFFGGSAPGFLEDNFFSIDRDRARELLLPLLPTDTIFPRSINGGNGRLSNFIDFVDLRNPFTEFNQALQNARNGSDARRNFAIAQTFDAQRENTELFGMVKYDFNENYDTFPVRGNFGVRYIKTDLSGLAEGQMEAGVGSYEKFLPSANIIADLTEDLVLQAAYYKTFEAFNLAEFNPTAAVISPAIPNPDAENPENRAGTLIINESNLGTDPRSSTAFDLGLAWYNRAGSIVGINFFTKEVTDIARQSTSGGNSPFCNAGFVNQVLDNPDAASEIGGGTPFIDDDGNCRLNLGAGNTPRLNLSQFTNTDPIRVNGIEFQVTQNTDFLDGFWGNFGGTFNYTYTTAESGEGFVLPRVSKNTYNLIGFYETEKFSIRLAQNYRSAYNLEAGGSFQGRERQVKARSQLDLSATYNPRKDLQFKVQAFNINNSLREEYEGFEVLSRRTDYDGRTFTFSVQKRF